MATPVSSISASDPSAECFATYKAVENENPDQARENVNGPNDRSSSLSDIEDRRSNNDMAFIDGKIDEIDTEAETERLEESPQKYREHKDTLVRLSNAERGNKEILDDYSNLRVDVKVDGNDQTSDISSLRDSSVETDRYGSPSSSPVRKRKRSDVESGFLNGITPDKGSPTTPGSPTRAFHPTTQETITQSPASRDKIGDKHRDKKDGKEDDMTDGKVAKRKRKDERRKDKRLGEKTSESCDPEKEDSNSPLEPSDNLVDMGSNAEDEETEEVLEDIAGDNPSRDEEGAVKKKSAMDDLSNIEKYFASLRDRLFEERLAKFNSELAMLVEPAVTHPELHGMKEVLEQRREEKIEYENKLLRYKLRSLQQRSIAERAQIRTQYIQTVRDIRGRNLEQVNREWYQIHRERRNRENDVPEYLYLLPTRKTQQIKHQSAYNKEVSLLSGIAKHRGFPAGPETGMASSSEISEDLRNMGIEPQAPTSTQRQAPNFRTNLPSSASLQRHKPAAEPAAEERFLEQNPWANPQHPVHQQIQRQAPGISRDTSPLIASGSQRRPTDMSSLHGSGSTTVEGHPGLRSLLAPAVPASEGGYHHASTSQKGQFEENNISDAPIRHFIKSTERIPSATVTPEGSSPRSRQSRLVDAERRISPPMPKVQPQTKTHIPKLLHSLEGTVPAPMSKAASSPPFRYSVVKTEDLPQLPRDSATALGYHRPIAIGAGGSGQSDQFPAS